MDPDFLEYKIDCNGKTKTLSFTQMAGESEDDFFARVRAEVDAAKAKCNGEDPS